MIAILKNNVIKYAQWGSPYKLGIQNRGLSRRNRYCDIPSITVGVLLEMPRPVPVLMRNPATRED